MCVRLPTLLLAALLCWPLAVLVAGEAPAAGVPAPPGAAAGQHDATAGLRLRKGLSVVFPISEGIDTHWKRIGDYDFKITVDRLDDEGLTYGWSMTYPADASGTRTVTPEDLKDSYKVSLFYEKSESMTMVGFTDAVRVSDALYGELKAGRSSPFELDGPDVPAGKNRDPNAVPKRISPAGEEEVYIVLNGQRTPVRALKAVTNNGWTYWVLDNPQFPMLVQGRGPFNWSEPRLDTAVADAQDVIRQLEEKGEATSYAIHFAFNSDAIEAPSEPILEELGKFLRENADVRLAVEGHTDSIGSSQYNLDLSQRRAEAVRNYLVNNCGIERNRLDPRGYGLLRPIADNGSEHGRALNRRVVFKKLLE